MRQLASVKKIASLNPIPGKDRIELATVDGWTVIVKKGEFWVDGPCVYVEIDSVLPDKPEFEFLRPKDFRIRTMKMAGVISQGICFRCGKSICIVIEYCRIPVSTDRIYRQIFHICTGYSFRPC